MSHAIHLSSKYAETKNGVGILLNRHNPNGWIETPKGQHLKQMPKFDNFLGAAICKLKKKLHKRTN